MPNQYVATDKRTGFEVSVTGEFPEHPDDRMRIARTTTLFTRLMSTLLEKEETQRRLGFRAIETQLELADALIRQDHEEVRRLLRDTLSSMGVDEQQMRDLAERLIDFGGMDPAVREELAKAFGFDPGDAPPVEEPPDLEQLLDPKVMDALNEALDASERSPRTAVDEALDAARAGGALDEETYQTIKDALDTADDALAAAKAGGEVTDEILQTVEDAFKAAEAALESSGIPEASARPAEESGESDHPQGPKDDAKPS